MCAKRRVQNPGKAALKEDRAFPGHRAFPDEGRDRQKIVVLSSDRNRAQPARIMLVPFL